MTDFKATKTQATLIAIASACAKFTNVGNFVSEVASFSSHGLSGKAFLRGRLDSGWEFEVVAPICPFNFNYEPPCFDQEVEVHFSQRLIREGGRGADWTGVDLRIRYSPLDGITIVATAENTCPSTEDLTKYARKLMVNEAGDSTIKLHVGTCHYCALVVELAATAIRSAQSRPSDLKS